MTHEELMTHEDFKTNYTCARYHGDTVYGGPHGTKEVGTVQAIRYVPDERTLMPDGRYMVVWLHGLEGSLRVPGFLNGYNRNDALKFASVKGE